MVGIIILNYNTYKDVFCCVENIEKNTHIDYKIYIVDNNSKNDSVEKIKVFISDRKRC